MATPRICKIDGCDKPVGTRGWCPPHYQRWRKFGDPLAGGPIGTSKGEPLRFYKETVLAYDGDDCLAWPYARSAAGYGEVWEGDRHCYVHRLVCDAVHGPAPTPDHYAAHSCGKGHEACCTKRHLDWKTPKENSADKLLHGTHHRGERHGQAKLTRSQVREIRALQGQMSQSAIAKRFGVGQAYVGQIQRRLCWGWLE